MKYELGKKYRTVGGKEAVYVGDSYYGAPCFKHHDGIRLDENDELVLSTCYSTREAAIAAIAAGGGK